MTERVRLMCDYGAGWPLWGERIPADRDLSPELAARLRAWQERFEECFHHELGWRTAADATAHADEGRRLQRLLTAEVGRSYTVELDLWPVSECP